MIQLGINTQAVERALKRLQKPLLQQAQATALNGIAFRVMRAERANFAKVFRHPRPFTVNSNLFTKATPALLTAAVMPKPGAQRYLKPYEFGGLHYLPTRPDLGKVLLVPVNMPLDAYGQPPAGLVKRIVTAAEACRNDLFIGTVGGVKGIWQRRAKPALPAPTKGRRKQPLSANTGVHLHPLLIMRIETNAAVPKHLDFEKIAQAIFDAKYQKEFAFALDRSIKQAGL